MKTLLGIVLSGITVASATELALVRIADLPLAASNPLDRLLTTDTDHDSLGEVIHNPGRLFQMAEYRPVNRYDLVISDTGHYPSGESILLGNLRPYDVCDVDRDGLLEVVGEAGYDSGSGYRMALCIFESRDARSHPDSLVWWIPTPNSAAACPALCSNLDGDSAWDIVTPWGVESTAVFENVGNDRESLVCTAPRSYVWSLPVIGDFDQNGRTDYAFGNGNFRGDHVVECIGDNRYERVCSVYTGSWGDNDRFSGRDVDHNGRPEYFDVVSGNLGGLRYSQTLCQVEAPFEHQYFCDTVDTASSVYEPYCGQSLCADVDGDSLDEVIWGCGYRIIILKATGPHQYERVCDGGFGQGIFSMCNAADFNRNGYKEILVGGHGQSFVLEVECIRVLSPDTNHFLRSGDTCEIRWRLFQPPRCDSVSLFLLTDTIVPTGEWFWRLDTIATGLAPSESSYVWVVPETTLAWAKILAIAYGPGWQFDESHQAFQIAPVGACEAPVAAPADWALSVSPSPAPGRAMACYDVPKSAEVRLCLFDAAGRVVAELASGRHTPGRYSVPLGAALPDGVYFVRLEAQGHQAAQKLVIQR